MTVGQHTCFATIEIFEKGIVTSKHVYSKKVCKLGADGCAIVHINAYMSHSD